MFNFLHLNLFKNSFNIDNNGYIFIGFEAPFALTNEQIETDIYIQNNECMEGIIPIQFN